MHRYDVCSQTGSLIPEVSGHATGIADDNLHEQRQLDPAPFLKGKIDSDVRRLDWFDLLYRHSILKVVTSGLYDNCCHEMSAVCLQDNN